MLTLGKHEQAHVYSRLIAFFFRFALIFNKLGCTSEIKMKIISFSFCISFGLH